ncbi:MAG TPA: hypothetical protein VJ183_13870 [Chloroflexia bacterium]|nr:hypothetical protein [Chloroflexia bacterium]
MVSRFSSRKVLRGRSIPALNILFAFACLLTLILVACDSDGDPLPTQTKVLPSTPTVATPVRNITAITPTHEGIPFQPTPVSTVPVPTESLSDIETAWDNQFQVNRVPLYSSITSYLQANTTTPDGKFLICAEYPRDIHENGGSQPVTLVMIDLLTHQTIKIHSGPRNDIRAYGASADENWIVWTEAPQEPGFFSDWVIYAYNRSDHSIKEVAKAPRNKLDSSLPVLGPDGTAYVDNGIVVWAEASPDRERSARAVVKSMDLATGQVEVLTENGLIPRISWPHVAWAESQDEPSTQIEGANKGLIVVLDLRTSATKKLTGPDTPKYFDMYNEALVWVTAQGKEIILTNINDETQQRTIARAGTDNTFERPSLNDRLVAWLSYDRKPRIWDRVQERVLTLGSKAESSHFVTKNALVWIASTSEQLPDASGTDTTRTINILDVNQLPK